MPGRLAQDDPDPGSLPPPPPPPPGSSQLPQPLEDVPGRKMSSVQQFEQLPPLSPEPDSDEDAELPTMWEDGGGLGVLGGAFSVGGKSEDVDGGDGRERALAAGQWAIVTEEAVRIFSEDVVVESRGANAGDRTVDDGDDDNSLSYEQRNNLIEQTLSEIYQSPFQQLNYAPPTSSTNSNHQAQQQLQRLPHRGQETSSPHRKKKSARFSDPDPESSERSSSGRRNPANRTADANGDDCRDDESANCNGDSSGNENENNDEGEDWSESEFSSSSPAESAGETSVAAAAAATADGTKAEASGGGSKADADSSMKASIARAARLAVSGYRTCDDADSYVGTRVKPTLILARAPPSPCGILRRTNKKAAVKVGHGNVRWADGRVSSLSSPEEVIPE